MLKKARLLTRPTLARQDAPLHRQGRNSVAVTLRFTVPVSDARTTLADFSSILLEEFRFDQVADPACCVA
jgi:hypothetical protein